MTADRTDEAAINDTPCDGMCVTASDVGIPGGWDDIAHAHPGCPRHDPDTVCDCGSPERCMSPTHGVIDLPTALLHRHRQNMHAPREDDR